MKFLLLIVLATGTTSVGTYDDQSQCLHAAAYLTQGETAPATIAMDSYCIPAPVDAG